MLTCLRQIDEVAFYTREPSRQPRYPDANYRMMLTGQPVCALRGARINSKITP